ncbi:MAG: STAS domain-containing protein [Pseudomonadota bacterium]|nr:STAS domain-containing protein [Pseudomonadota bacterium]
MPAAEAGASLAREGDALRFSGALLGDAVPGAWRQVGAQSNSVQLRGVRRFDLKGVTRVDSAGVALLAELAARCGGDIVLDGDPEGLSELRAAYRLAPSLAFAS